MNVVINSIKITKLEYHMSVQINKNIPISRNTYKKKVRKDR